MLRREFLGAIGPPLLIGPAYPTITHYTQDDYGCVEEVIVDPQKVDYIFSKQQCNKLVKGKTEEGVDFESGYLHIKKDNGFIAISTCFEMTNYEEYADICWQTILGSAQSTMLQQKDFTRSHFKLDDLHSLFCYGTSRTDLSKKLKISQRRITDVFIDSGSKYKLEDSNGIKVYKISLNKYRDYLEDKL